MFNPITLIQSVWRWFTNTFSRLTSFTKLKFFLISLFLFGIGWYYIKCYETPIYQTGHEMRYFSCEPVDAPNVELHFRFNHNNLEGGITYCSCIVDSINLRPVKEIDSLVEPLVLTHIESYVDSTDMIFGEGVRRRVTTHDTITLGMLMRTTIPLRQPFLFKQRSILGSTINKTHIRLCGLQYRQYINEKTYRIDERLQVSDYCYTTDCELDSHYMIATDTFEYPIACKPQWRCKGDLSTFIFRFAGGEAETHNYNIGKICCEFNDYISIRTMHPQPDSVWATGFAYTDPQTLKLVQTQGADGFGLFPRMEAWQMVRTFALTTLLATLISLFLGLLYNFISRRPAVLSFSILTIASLIISLLAYTLVYEWTSSAYDYRSLSGVLGIVAKLAIYILICIISYQFMYHICKKYKVNIWAIIIIIPLYFIVSHISIRLTSGESIGGIGFAAGGVIWILCVLLPIIIYLRRESHFVRIFRRYFHSRPTDSGRFSSKVEKLKKITISMCISLLAALIGVIANMHNASPLFTHLIIIMVSIATLLCVDMLYVITLAKVVGKSPWKGVVIVSSILSPYANYCFLIAMIYVLLTYLSGFMLYSAMIFALLFLIVYISIVLLPFVYKPAVVLRYLQYTRPKRTATRKKVIRHLYRM